MMNFRHGRAEQYLPDSPASPEHKCKENLDR